MSAVEMMPGLPIGNLAAAVSAITTVAKPNLRLLLDSMHVFRSGASVSDIAALDPAMIGYVQLCDAPVISKHESYADEARYYRLPPGAGELPLLAFIAALPPDLSLGLEIPMLAEAQAGISPAQRLNRCVEATRSLLV